MGSDLKYLSKLIDMVENEGNDHNRKRLWSLVGMLAKKELGDITDRETKEVLSEVHELNLEQYIRVQAKHFYDDFPFPEIKEQLISDFIEMEHCRRRDDFYRFCIAAYQQIENVTNYLYKKFSYWPETVAQIGREIPVLSSSREKKWNFSLCNQLVYQPDRNIFNLDLVNAYIANEPRDLKFTHKFKIVLFFGYFKNEKINLQQWKTIYDLGDKLYAARNKVHRGTIDTDRQAEKLHSIEKNKYNYYLLLSGFLADFVNKICSNYIGSSK